MHPPDRKAGGRRAAVLLALRYYGRELAHRPGVAVPALLLPALGNICLLYLAPLVVGDAGGPGRRRATRTRDRRRAAAVLVSPACCCPPRCCGGSASHCLNRTDGRGIEHLYVFGMDELLAKDAAFFHDNFAGSLTKRVLSFASPVRGVRGHAGVPDRRQPHPAGLRLASCCGATTRCWSWCCSA